MRIRVLAFLSVAILLPVASQGQDKTENPFSKAVIGDYAAYNTTTSVNGVEIVVNVKQTVTAKSATAVTIQVVSTLAGNNKSSSRNVTIDLTNPNDPPEVVQMATFYKGKWEKTGGGREMVTIGAKTYDCHWIAGKGVTMVGGAKFAAEIKVWVARLVPVGGMVKMHMKSTLLNLRTEITDSGSAN